MVTDFTITFVNDVIANTCQPAMKRVNARDLNYCPAILLSSNSLILA